MTTIIAIAARLVPALSLSKKKSGKPTAQGCRKTNELPLRKVESDFCFDFG